MLVTAALNDSRVAYWHAAKWVAKAQRFRDHQRENRGHIERWFGRSCDDTPVLLHVSPGGHSGVGGHSAQHHDTALTFAFLHKAMGLDYS